MLLGTSGRHLLAKIGVVASCSFRERRFVHAHDRERADLDDDVEQYKKDIQIAGDWVQKALQTKKAKAERKPTGGGITTDGK